MEILVVVAFVALLVIAVVAVCALAHIAHRVIVENGYLSDALRHEEAPNYTRAKQAEKIMESIGTIESDDDDDLPEGLVN